MPDTVIVTGPLNDWVVWTPPMPDRNGTTMVSMAMLGSTSGWLLIASNGASRSAGADEAVCIPLNNSPRNTKTVMRLVKRCCLDIEPSMVYRNLQEIAVGSCRTECSRQITSYKADRSRAGVCNGARSGIHELCRVVKIPHRGALVNDPNHIGPVCVRSRFNRPA